MSAKYAKAAHKYTTGPIAKQARENPNQYAKMQAKSMQRMKKSQSEGWNENKEMSFKDFVNQIQERELTPTELERKEEIVKSMKKRMPEFEKNYGKNAKSVMYATATKMAKNES
jgi:hypothetical protein